MWSRRLLSLPQAAPRADALPAVLALAMLLSLAACQTVAPPPPPPPPGDVIDVTLKAVGDEECVEVQPPVTEIWWQEVAGRPHQVRWTVLEGQPYRWIVAFKDEEGEKDHFGQRVIPCRAPGRSVISGLPAMVTHSPGNQVEWTYRVILESCEPGPPQKVCETDPVIIIRDVQF